MKKQWRNVCVSLILLCVLCLCFGIRTHAAGLIPEDTDTSSEYYHERYSTTEHYLLDYQYTTDGIFAAVYGKVSGSEGVSFVIFSIIQVLWIFSMTMSKFGTYLLTMAYDFDLVDKAVDKISAGLQKLLGVSANGLTQTGLLPTFLIITLLILGGYVVVTGLFKREYTKSYSAVANYVVIVLLAAVFAINAGDYVRTVNNLSNEVSGSILSIGTGLVTGNQTNGDVTDEIEEILFSIQVREPWLYLEFGDTEEASVGAARVAAVESQSVSGEERSAAVEKDIEDNSNTMMTQTGLFFRFAGVLLFGILNFVITLFVAYFAVLLILAQVLLLVYVFVLPATFIVGLIPGKHRVAYAGMQNAFKQMVIKIGISLILMITFSISVFLAEISQGSVLLFRLFLQLVCYIGVYLSLNRINQMLGMEGAGTMGRPSFGRMYHHYRSHRFMKSMSRRNRTEAPEDETSEDSENLSGDTHRRKKASGEERSAASSGRNRKSKSMYGTDAAKDKKTPDAPEESRKHETEASEKPKKNRTEAPEDKHQKHPKHRKPGSDTASEDKKSKKPKNTPTDRALDAEELKKHRKKPTKKLPKVEPETEKKRSTDTRTTSGNRKNVLPDGMEETKKRPHGRYRKPTPETDKNRSTDTGHTPSEASGGANGTAGNASRSNAPTKPMHVPTAKRQSEPLKRPMTKRTYRKRRKGGDTE